MPISSGEHGSGDGGPLGTPSRDLKEAPPGADQSENMVVSGGGVASTEDEDGATGASDRGLG